MSCEQTRALAAELALGITDGAERAQALRHLAECAECRRHVEELSAVADDLLLLAPDHAPPAGFESRVLERIAPAPRPRRRRRRRVLVPVAAAAAAALAAAALVFAATGDDRRLAEHYRETLAVAHGHSFEAAPLRDPGGAHAGIVYGYRGKPSWIFVALYRPYRSKAYTVQLETGSGRRVPLPSWRVDPTTGSAGQTIPIDLQKVKAVRLVGSRHDDVLEAPLAHAR
jgi:hypothetical protein